MIKPCDLLKRYCVPSFVDEKIFPYMNRECVIAYSENKRSCIFIIKSKRTFFGFYYTQKKIRKYSPSKETLMFLDLTHAINIIREEGKVLDGREYEKLKRELLLKNLK